MCLSAKCLQHILPKDRAHLVIGPSVDDGMYTSQIFHFRFDTVHDVLLCEGEVGLLDCLSTRNRAFSFSYLMSSRKLGLSTTESDNAAQVMLFSISWVIHLCFGCCLEYFDFVSPRK